jgi:flagellar basal-body rod protein FlgB
LDRVVFRNIAAFALASARMAHASQRNNVIARNIAQADTPGFKAQDVEQFGFSSMVARGPDAGSPKATRPGHLEVRTVASPARAEVVTAPATNETPDGNTVDLEEQIVKAAETRATFELASTLYAKNLSLLRTVLSRGS